MVWRLRFEVFGFGPRSRSVPKPWISPRNAPFMLRPRATSTRIFQVTVECLGFRVTMAHVALTVPLV